MLNFNQIYLFASRLNQQFQTFISFRSDPETSRIDAFSFNWQGHNFYAFPSFSLLSRLLKKITKDKTIGIVVAHVTVRSGVVISKVLGEIGLLTRKIILFSSFPHASSWYFTWSTT